MKSKILWVDNDPGYIKPFVMALEDEGFEVLVAPDVSSAEDKLLSGEFNLLILDVMIPTISEGEEAKYTPAETENSLKTGLVFYKRMSATLNSKKIPVLV